MKPEELLYVVTVLVLATHAGIALAVSGKELSAEQGARRRGLFATLVHPFWFWVTYNYHTSLTWELDGVTAVFFSLYLGTAMLGQIALTGVTLAILQDTVEAP